MEKLAFVTAVVVLAGCTSTWDIPVNQATAIQPGATVRTTSGEDLQIRDVYNVRVRSFPGAVFVPSYGDPDVFSVAPTFAVPDGQTGDDETPWLLNSPRLVQNGVVLSLRGGPENRTQQVPLFAVSAIQIQQVSPGKTAGILLGAGIPAVLAITMLALVVQGFSHFGGVVY